MIAKNKKRVSLSIDKQFLEDCQYAAAEWGLTLTDYFLSLARQDQSIGLTAQARCMVSSRAKRGAENEPEG